MIYSKTRAALLAACAVAGVHLPSTASAQTSPTTGPENGTKTPDAGAGAPANDDKDGGDIIVTATRQNSTVNRVSLSISAFDQEALDQRGARQVDDIFRFTPGVTFSRGGTGGSTISIRGVGSNSGASTTGVYLDDAPIQTRALGFFPTTIYPAIFDLERVEVLRGPQGTLFGAGSEGGTVRFITPQPSLSGTSMYGRAELSTTEGGDESYEVGIALGAPLIKDALGFRASVWRRRDGGYIDRIAPADGSIVDRDSDWRTSTAARLALGAALGKLTVTPSIYYERLFYNDAQAYTNYLSNPDKGKFNNGAKVSSPFRSTVWLPSLHAVFDGGGVAVDFNTSYYDQNNINRQDYSNFIPTLLGVKISPTAGLTGYPDYKNQTAFENSQKVFSNELRIRSSNDTGLFSWVLGVFQQSSKQFSGEYVPETAASWNGLIQAIFHAPPSAIFAVPLVDGKYSYTSAITARENQIAIFGEVTIRPLPGLSLTAGARISDTRYKFSSLTQGPFNNGTSQSEGEQKERPFTPKVSVTYEFNDRNRVYATAAKGFRVGGANAALPARCGTDLSALGYSNSPNSYDSDSVWSYEIGSKNRLFGNLFRVNSSAYLIKWDNIQQSVYLPGCGLNFVANVGKATSKGFDLDAEVRPARGLLLQLAVGYNRATYDQSILAAPNTAGVRATIIREGNSLGNNPWTVATAAEYDFIIGTKEIYLRGDYQHTSAATIPTPNLDPATNSYNALAIGAPTTNYVTLRAGTRLPNGIDLSLFVNNLLNDTPELQQTEVGSPANSVLTTTTFRPRTFGITATFRR